VQGTPIITGYCFAEYYRALLLDTARTTADCRVLHYYWLLQTAEYLKVLHYYWLLETVQSTTVHYYWRLCRVLPRIVSTSIGTPLRYRGATLARERDGLPLFRRERGQREGGGLRGTHGAQPASA